MRRLVWVALAAAGCGAGSRVVLDPGDVSPELVGAEAPFATLRLSWVETGNERYDRFFREAAALQGALILAERAAAGAGDPARIVPVLAALQERAAAAIAEGEALLPRARADFAGDEKKAWAIEPAIHEALGMLRDARERAPGMLAALRGAPAVVVPAGARGRESAQ